MAKPTAWMPMYWGDYLRDTSHLSVEEHGAYLLLIAHYWSTGRALDEKYLQNILQLSNYKMKKYLPVLAAFFTIENGHWHHPRIERELIEAFNRKDAAIKRGKQAAATRWGDKASINQAIVKHSNHSHIKNHESESLTAAARDPARNEGSGPRAAKPETSKERLLRLAEAHRQQTLRKGQT